MDVLVISILAQNKTEINKQKARLARAFRLGVVFLISRFR